MLWKTIISLEIPEIRRICVAVTFGAPWTTRNLGC